MISGPGVYCSEPVFVPITGYPFRGSDPNEPWWLLSEL
jgi:hypothetical protein